MSEYIKSEYNKQYSKDRQKWLHEHHFCVDCKKQDAYTLNGKWRCAICSEKARKKRTGQEYNREQRKEMGLCLTCGKPVKQGYMVCEEHYIHLCEMSKISHKDDGEGRKTDRSSNPPFPRSEWIDNGYCYLCGDERLLPYKVCAKCRERLISIREKQKAEGKDYKIRAAIDLYHIIRKSKYLKKESETKL